MSAHGLDPMRPIAAHAGLASVAAPSVLHPIPPPVGELVGVGAAQEQTVVGETPNLAARLQALAEPGSVVISQATRRLIGELFELTALGPRRFKGFAEPLAAWRVLGEGRTEGRFEARHRTGLTPLVGREEEISLLLRHWRQAKDGEGQVVLLVGHDNGPLSAARPDPGAPETAYPGSARRSA